MRTPDHRPPRMSASSVEDEEPEGPLNSHIGSGTKRKLNWISDDLALDIDNGSTNTPDVPNLTENSGSSLPDNSHPGDNTDSSLPESQPISVHSCPAKTKQRTNNASCFVPPATRPALLSATSTSALPLPPSLALRSPYFAPRTSHFRLLPHRLDSTGFYYVQTAFFVLKGTKRAPKEMTTPRAFKQSTFRLSPPSSRKRSSPLARPDFTDMPQSAAVVLRAV
ncbi:hypothetical protein C8R46DRAFT_1313480 [Mycena filopes]|nr:hypothetical protein C8R46DRAFT_1313480 [Mycena filopes]